VAINLAFLFARDIGGLLLFFFMAASIAFCLRFVKLIKKKITHS